MDMSNFISFKKGYINYTQLKKSRELFEKIWNGYEKYIQNLDLDIFLNALSKDKKNKGNLLGLILNRGYGKVFKDFTKNNQNFRKWMYEYFKHEIV